MFLWFVASSVLTIHFVFGDPRFDHRWLIVGSAVPVIADIIGGWAAMISSVAVGVAVLITVMLATIGRRDLRRSVLGLPIGVLLHMVFGASWNTTTIFWWPFSGADLATAPSLWAERWPVSVALEALGLVGIWWIISRNSLMEPNRRSAFLGDGRLEF